MNRCALTILALAAASAPAFAAALNLDGTPLITVDGAEVTFSDEMFSAPATVVSFTFSGCRSICPVSDLVMNQVATAAVDTGMDIRLLTFTIDPGNDSPAVLAAHRDKYGFGENDNWQWITGEPENVWNVLDLMGMNAGALNDHQTVFIVVGRGAKEVESLWESTATAESILASANRLSQQ